MSNQQSRKDLIAERDVQQKLLNSMNREYNTSFGQGHGSDFEKIQKVSRRLEGLKSQLASMSMSTTSKKLAPTQAKVSAKAKRSPDSAPFKSSFLPIEPEPKPGLVTDFEIHPIIDYSRTYGFQPREKTKQQPQKAKPEQARSTFLPPQASQNPGSFGKQPPAFDLGLNPIFDQGQGWHAAYVQQRNEEKKTSNSVGQSAKKSGGAYQYDVSNIFRAPSDIKGIDPNSWLYGNNSGVESPPKPQPKPIVPTLQNTKTITLGTRFGKVRISAPGWIDFSLEEKTKFKNMATKKVESFFEKQGKKPFRGATLPLTPPSESAPYAGDFLTDLNTIERMADGFMKAAKFISPLSQADYQSRGRINKLLRSVADKIKIVPDRPDDPNEPWFGKALEGLINPDLVVSGALNYPSTIVESVADVIDPNVGTVQSTLGATNLIPFFRGAGKSISKGVTLVKSRLPTRPIVLPPEISSIAGVRPPIGSIRPNGLPRPIQEVKATLSDYEPVPPSKAISPWQQSEVKGTNSSIHNQLGIANKSRKGDYQRDANHEIKSLNERLETSKRGLDHFTGLIETNQRDNDYSPLLGGHSVKKISLAKIKYITPKGSMMGIDGHWIEIHHGPNGFVEMTRTEHRGKGNFLINHPGGRGYGEYDVATYRKFKRVYKKDAWHQSRLKRGK
jgi:hypothetical protein